MSVESRGDFADHLPLPAAQFHILLALADGEKHGYAVMGEVERLTDGAVVMGPGTLYGSIKRMLTAGLIEEAESRTGSDERRRYYRVTGLGEEVFTAEMHRLETLLRAAHGRARPGFEGA